MTELTKSERVLIAAIEGLIEAESALMQAKAHADGVTAGLAPEGADDWMHKEAVRVRLVEASAPVAPAVVAMMHAVTEARGAIVAAYHGGELPADSRIPADTSERPR
jgi:hypothetical protein